MTNQFDRRVLPRSAPVSNAVIEQVMSETGMDRMQAYYHVRGRTALLEQLDRTPRDERFTLGKSQYD